MRERATSEIQMSLELYENTHLEDILQLRAGSYTELILLRHSYLSGAILNQLVSCSKVLKGRESPRIRGDRRDLVRRHLRSLATSNLLNLDDPRSTLPICLSRGGCKVRHSAETHGRSKAMTPLPRFVWKDSAGYNAKRRTSHKNCNSCGISG
jgi:hypothetical protein